MTPVPLATYRLQFTPEFGFGTALPVIEYLHALGISHVYASPIFAARKGSTHGYDVVDPNTLNAELGSIQEYDSLHARLGEYHMGWIQDIVPNHMAFDSQNWMLMDVLENGPASPFYHHFDINWDHPYESLRGKVLAPFLGRFFGECLEDGELRICFNAQGFQLTYYELRFPLRIESYATILTHDLRSLEQALGGEHPDYHSFAASLEALKQLSSLADRRIRKQQIEFIKEALWRTYTSNDAVAGFIDATLARFNGVKGKPDSFQLLDALLADQHFRLSFWKVANEEINYRRFFNINELISVRMEDEEVFRSTHAFILRQLWSGRFAGVRVDHVDGLRDPETYLRRLHAAGQDRYIVVEKILHPDETLPPTWPVQGTTGYDFLASLNGLFCERQHDRRFEKIYERFIGSHVRYETLVADRKRLIIGRHMAGDIDNLAQLLKSLSSKDRYARDITLHGLRRALVEILALFPVYRTYIRELAVGEHDRTYITEAIGRARALAPALVLELDFIERFLLLAFDERLSNVERESWLGFVMAFQQLTGPLMAKGFEDTAMYIYNRLISLNEVGGSPDRFGTTAVQFHYFNIRRTTQSSYAMNATSTHDTKRGEDVRARINVLSEIPEEWANKITTWRKMNAGYKPPSHGREIPDANDEYLYYQTLIGTYPFEPNDADEYKERIKAYLVKAVREAKVHTAWLKHDREYEEGFLFFVESTLRDTKENYFFADITAFCSKIASYGILNSLSQVVLKMTCPGVPDFYQGAELWDFNLVDPDNRRPVDFKLRMRLLGSIMEEFEARGNQFIEDLLVHRTDGRIKLFIIHRLLQARKAHTTLLSDGEYIPLAVKGKKKEHLFAFARRKGKDWMVVTIPRLFTRLVEPAVLPLGKAVWGETALELPTQAPIRWRSALTEEIVDGTPSLNVGTVLQRLPVNVLFAEHL